MFGIIFHSLRHAVADRIRREWRAGTRRERPLRIGIDIRPFYEPLTGVGWYLYHLLHELAKRDDVELFLFGDARVTDAGPRLHAAIPANARLCWFDLRGRPPGRFMKPVTAAAYLLWMRITGCDVIFGANYFLPRLLGAVARRRVITIHDLTYKRFPELLQKETLDNLERQMTREVAVADAIVCVSESTRRDLLEFYQVDPSRAVAIHSGLTAMPVADAPALPARYILFVSTIEPRKNLGVLLDAYATLRRRGAYDGALVVVGRIGWKSKTIAARLREPGVVHLDYVDAAHLGAVYAGVDAFVFPSIYEGFGFPLLEAMAHGVPAIAACSSSLPEIGGDAALYFETRNELESALERVLTDASLRDEMVRRGHERVRLFDWSVTAEKTLVVLRRAAG